MLAFFCVSLSKDIDYGFILVGCAPRTISQIINGISRFYKANSIIIFPMILKFPTIGARGIPHY